MTHEQRGMAGPLYLHRLKRRGLFSGQLVDAVDCPIVMEFEALMKRAQAGDAAAYVELLNEITPILRRTIRRQRAFLSTEDIEDLVQEVLLSVHAVRATYDPSRPFIPWLFAITKNRL